MRTLPALTGVLLFSSLAAGPLQAAGDAVRGEALYQSRCIACHSPDAHRVGPKHRGVFGREAGTAEGYDYSPALLASRVVWNETTLDRWLSDPDALIPGQKMGYRTGSAGDRRDLIAFLRGLSP